MIDVLTDIEDLNSALVLIKEGASDEKQQGIGIIENMVTKKQDQVIQFEKQMELEFMESYSAK
jgi:hypothetical protein